MKKVLFLIFGLSFLINLNAQDVIIKKDGSEVEVKVLEIGAEFVKYKKLSNLDGPIYSITKNEIFLIKYENGEKDIFNDLSTQPISNKNIVKKNYIRKGLHLGAHITPGTGSVSINFQEKGFAINGGVDFNIFFTDNVGIGTGLSFLAQKIKYKYDYYEEHNGEVERYRRSETGDIFSFGIPTKFIFVTGKKVGFLMMVGLTVYFPISSKLEDMNDNYSGLHSSVVIAGEYNVGANIKMTDLSNLQFSIFGNYALTNYFITYPTSNGFMYGLQLAATFKLSK